MSVQKACKAMKFGSVQIQCSKCVNVLGKVTLLLEEKKKSTLQDFERKNGKKFDFEKKCKTNKTISLRHLY